VGGAANAAAASSRCCHCWMLPQIRGMQQQRRSPCGPPSPAPLPATPWARRAPRPARSSR
jgi:hypothetical protein